MKFVGNMTALYFPLRNRIFKKNSYSCYRIPRVEYQNVFLGAPVRRPPTANPERPLQTICRQRLTFDAVTTVGDKILFFKDWYGYFHT